jgi:hypothetical protein
MIEMASTLRLHFLLQPAAAKENLESGSMRLGVTDRRARASTGRHACDLISINQSRAGDVERVSRPARSF